MINAEVIGLQDFLRCISMATLRHTLGPHGLTAMDSHDDVYRGENCEAIRNYASMKSETGFLPAGFPESMRKDLMTASDKVYDVKLTYVGVTSASVQNSELVRVFQVVSSLDQRNRMERLQASRRCIATMVYDYLKCIRAPTSSLRDTDTYATNGTDTGALPSDETSDQGNAGKKRHTGSSETPAAKRARIS